ncbi:MAG TPA: PIG-L family deacetylase [Candidatus Sulfotelmatobacter sp.]|jgi:LmbE family N-acetylglucosaminyl deacetylase|nr:PIG-L family deacetylase [Candidatus Sulfotelmatobacter sp.]
MKIIKKDLVKIIKENNYNCIFISPHSDDAILSCGGLIENLIGKTSITIINVFTSAHKGPYTLSAKVFMKSSHGSNDARAFYQERVAEDRKVWSQLSLTPQNLGLEDALFRKKQKTSFLGKLLPEIDHIYPTYRWHILKSISSSDPAIILLKKKLSPYRRQKNLIFAPYGIGNHADHRLVRKICEELFDNLILYSDFPYNIRLNTYGEPLRKGDIFRIKPSIDKKIKLIAGYKTQFQALFGGTVPDHEEVFFSNKPL